VLKQSDMRIGIIGAGGTGKSSLAFALSKRLGVPFLASKEITRKILERDGYDYMSGVQVERFLANGSRQEELLRDTLASQTAGSSWVTDRTVIDLAAYAICELHDHDSIMVRRIIDGCRKQSKTYTHLFLCPWKDTTVRANNVRTLNPWYQFKIHALDLALSLEWGCEVVILKSKDTDERVGEVVRLIGG